MAIRFSYEIGEKPVGNWRPKITFSYSWGAKDIAHNPQIKSIYLVAPGLQEASRMMTVSEFTNAVKKDVYMVYVELPSDGEPWSLYAYASRGDTRTFVNAYTSAEKRPYSYLCLLDADKIDPAGKFESETKFYGPWKPGTTPNYSEIVPILKSLGETIARNLDNGKDSGSSARLGDDFVLKNGVFVSKEEAKAIEMIQGKVRKIDIDDDEEEPAKEEKEEEPVNEEEMEAASDDRFSIKIDEDDEEVK